MLKNRNARRGRPRWRGGSPSRRLLRRAARHGKLLGVNEPFLYEVCDTVIHENEGHYPELRERQADITKGIRVEEENFAKTIDGGMKIFSDMLAEHKAKGETKFSGEDAFKLYDTYGFPIDLTREMAADEGLSVDEEAFAMSLAEMMSLARVARMALGVLGWAGVECGKDIPSTEFVGYDHDSIDDAKRVALVVEGEQAEEMMSGVEGIVVLDKTPFYAEMGGQGADHGVITFGDAKFEVADVQKNKGGKYMHTGKVVSGSFKLGDTVTASIDVERRKSVRRAHTATHLLDAALKHVLGDHVHQAGSLVEPDRLRFDFTHFEGITPEQLAAVDAFVNDAVLEGIPVVTEVLPIEEAKKKGAVAMFGEKYGDVVRVVEMGDVSMEFCGGTHVDNTAKVGPFRFKSEASVASGVRRIEATVGQLTLDTINRNQQVLFHIAQLFKTNPGELENRLEQQMNEMKDLRHELEKFKEQASLGEARSFLASAKTVGELKVITALRDGMDAAAMRKQGDFLRDKEPDVVGVLASVNDGKVTLLAVCGKDAVAKGVKAGDKFLGDLAGVSDPETKRKIIGRDFVEVFNEEAIRIEDVRWLAQGTIYPDVIESVSVNGPSATIKSHHNVGGLPEKMHLRIVEPLRLLFKDEVRRVGRSLGISEQLIGRHPFPGPGLAIRILGDITPEKVAILQDVDKIYIDALRDAGLYDKVWQAGAILLPVKSVGVMGDERTYESCVALRAVTSTDGMTADWVHLPYEFLANVSNDIINKVKGVNRVVYDISSKPPATIEWE